MRRNTIGKGKFPQYLLYAVGEIFLVMIGILLALQVNTWNENRKLINEEVIAINNLSNEFDRNHDELSRVYRAKKSSEKGTRNYLQILTSDSLTNDYKASIERPDIGGYTWNPTNPILNSLLNTGKIDNLKNDSLKVMLTSWNDLVEDYLEQQLIYSEVDIPNLYNYESKRIPLKVMQGNYTLATTKEAYVSSMDVSKARERIVEELAYHNQLSSCVNRLYIQVMSAQEVMQVSDQIQESLEREATRKKD